MQQPNCMACFVLLENKLFPLTLVGVWVKSQQRNIA